MEDTAKDHLADTDEAEAAPRQPLSRARIVAYGVILAAGAVAMVWMGLQSMSRQQCGCCAKNRKAMGSAAARTLVEDFAVPVLGYKGDRSGLEAIREHSIALRARGYDIVSVSQIAGALRERGRLPERCVAFAVEAGGKLPVAETRALVVTAAVPLTVFVDPTRTAATLSWDDLMQLQAHGAEFHCLVAGPEKNAGRLRAALRAFREKTQRADLHLMAASPKGLAHLTKLAASAGIPVVWYAGSKAVRADSSQEERVRTHRAVITLPVVMVPDRTDEDEIAERVAVLSARQRGRDGVQKPAQVSAKPASPDHASRATEGTQVQHETDGGSAE